jgi:hypothetical protein
VKQADKYSETEVILQANPEIKTLFISSLNHVFLLNIIDVINQSTLS